VAGGIEPAYYHNIAITESPVITISGSGANAGFTRLYYERIWASDCSYVDSQGTKAFYFTYCYLKDNKATLDNLKKGSAQPHVYTKDINALSVAKPAENILYEYENVCSSYFKKIALCHQVIQNAIEARDRLLPRMISGELDV
ncbi:MAG: restriction endonuclease subunit S, partial [Clostridia bacterium]|nr:restriction endonuclease subunit S [Clostridia bacterium]